MTKKLLLPLLMCSAFTASTAHARRAEVMRQFGEDYRLCRDGKTADACESLAVRYNSMRDAGLLSRPPSLKRMTAEELASRYDTIRCLGDSSLTGNGFYCAENGNLYETFKACAAYCVNESPAAASTAPRTEQKPDATSGAAAR